MAFGIIRIRNLHAGQISQTEIHNERTHEDHKLDLPKHIDPELTEINTNWKKSNTYEGSISDRLKEMNVKGIRKNSIKAVEILMSASKDFFNDTEKYPAYDPDAYFSECRKWLKDRYGADNLVSFSVHLDEPGALPHMHVILTPIQEKKVKWKNRNGSGHRIENRLCQREWFGGPEKLENLQQGFYEFVSDRFKGYADWCRRTKAEQQLREYTRETSHDIGLIKAQIDAVTNDNEKQRLLDQLKAKKAAFELKSNEMHRNIKIKKDKNKGEGWKKGIDFDFAEKPKKREKPKADTSVPKSKSRIKPKPEKPKPKIGPPKRKGKNNDMGI